jgi:hypothetical protein
MNSTLTRDHSIEALEASVVRAAKSPITRALEFVGAAGMGAIAYIHLLDVKSKLSEVPYLGVGYIALIIASLVAMIFLVRGDHRGWKIGGAFAAATFIGYCLSRTVGLPGSTDDIGNWGETLGVYSLIIEAGVVALAAMHLRPVRR